MAIAGAVIGFIICSIFAQIPLMSANWTTEKWGILLYEILILTIMFFLTIGMALWGE